MKIRLVLYSEDTQYAQHLVDYLSVRHSDTVELNVFSDVQAMEECLEDYKADLILLDGEISYQPKRGEEIIRLTEDAEFPEEELCIFKYQKGELIYKAILNVFASGADRALRRQKGESEAETGVHLFMPLNGGAGASTVAKAYALKNAAECRVLYLNLEIFGDCEKALKADGQFSFDDILYALKSRRGSISLKLESSLKKSQEGVCFYAPSENPTNLLDLTETEFHQLMEEIKRCGLFDLIILDMDIFPSPWMKGALKEADRIWLVADGTESSSEKYGRFEKFVLSMEKKTQIRILAKAKVFYNKYSSRTGKPIENCELRIAGGSPRYEGSDKTSIIRKMAGSDAFDRDRIE